MNEKLKIIMEKLEDAINDIDGVYTDDYHYNSELSRIGDLILASRNRLKDFIERN